MLTLTQIAALVARALTAHGEPTPEELRLAANRLKFWASVEALPPIASDKRGHGIKRAYERQSAFVAVALAALADAGVPVHRYADISSQLIRHPEWQKLIANRIEFVLTVALARDRSIVFLTNTKTSISSDSPTVTVNLSALYAKILPYLAGKAA